MKWRRSGFTLIELMFALILIAILGGALVPAFGRMQVQRQVTNARNAFLILGATAKATASGTGLVTYFELDPSADVALVYTSVPDTVGRIYFQDEHDTDVQASGALLLCYTSRGLALPACSTGSYPATITFASGPESAQALVRALGQLERQ